MSKPLQVDRLSEEPVGKPTGARRTRWVIGCLAVVVACALGVLFLFWLGSREHFMVVSTVDASGRPVGMPSIEWIPAPEHVRENGLSKMRARISQLLASQARSASLMAFPPDGQRGVGLSFTGGALSINLSAERRTAPQQERAIRSLFQSLKIAPSQDYVANNGGVAILSYPLPANVGPATSIVRRVMREVYGVQDQEPLEYTYEESR
jgi:hypothetical protein